ncbi:MAG: hypothetical protein JKY01_01520 [Pseudomonadales bacterium]|nr:hypothetical protein [Pseudomonadales bacterium]
MKTLSFFVIIITLLSSVILAIANPEQVTLWVGFSEVKATNGQLLVYAFSCGAAIGLAAMLFSLIASQVKVGFLQHRVENLQSELDSIKRNGLSENV